MIDGTIDVEDTGAGFRPTIYLRVCGNATPVATVWTERLYPSVAEAERAALDAWTDMVRRWLLDAWRPDGWRITDARPALSA